MAGYLSNLLVRLGVDPSDLNAGLDKASRSVKKFGADLSAVGQTLALGITAPIAALAAGSIKAAADMESLKMALTTITGSSAETATQLNRLKEVAKLPGLGFQEAVQGSINLQAAGFSAGLAERSLKAFGNALATVGKGRADLEGVNLVLTQIINKPKVMAQDLNQLRERLPQISQMMKAAFGTNVSEDIQKLGVTGQQFVEIMVAQFAKLPPVTSGFKNSLENLKDTMFLTAVQIGDALLPLGQNIIDFASKSVEHIKKIATAFGELPKPLQNVVIGTTAAAAAFPLLAIGLGQTISNVVIIGNAFTKFGGVLSKLSGTVGIPFAILAAAIAGLKWTGAIDGAIELGKAVKDNLSGIADFFSPLTNALKEAWEGFKNVITVARLVFPVIDVMAKGFAYLFSQLKLSLILFPQFAALKDLLDAAAKVIEFTGGRYKSMGEAAQGAIDKVTTANNQTAHAAAEAAGGFTKGGDAALKFGKSAKELAKEAKALEKELKAMRDGFHAIPFAEKSAQGAFLTAKLNEGAAATRKWFDALLPLADTLDRAITVAFLNAAESVEKFFTIDAPVAKWQAPIEDASKALKEIMGVFAGSGIPEEIERINDAASALGVNLEKTNIPDLTAKYNDLEDAYNRNAISLRALNQAYINLIKAKAAAGEATDAEIAKAKALEEASTVGMRKTAKERYDLGRELEQMGHRTFDSLERDLARNIVSWKGWADTIKNVGQGFAEDFLSIMFKALFKPLEDQFAKLAGKIGGWLGGILGGGGSAASTAAGGAASAAGGVASAGGGAAGTAGKAVSSGLTGIVSAVSGVVSAVSSVIGNFQMAGMNKSLDIIVNHTLATANDLANLRRDSWDRHNGLMLKLDDMWNSIRDVSAAIHGTGTVNSKQAIQLTVNLDGKAIWSGMANAAQLAGV